MSLYEKYLLPHFLNCACGSKPISHQRQKVVPLARGIVLEIGIGSGLNTSFYCHQAVNKIIGLDPSTELQKMAASVAKEYRLPVEFILGSAEKIPLSDNSVDTVLVTYSLCTIKDVHAAIREMHRLLKTDGSFIFCEHGLAPDSNTIKWQNRLDPWWGKISGGCHLNRDIPQLIKSAGFNINWLEQMYLPSMPKFAGYNYWGLATTNSG